MLVCWSDVSHCKLNEQVYCIYTYICTYVMRVDFIPRMAGIVVRRKLVEKALLKKHVPWWKIRAIEQSWRSSMRKRWVNEGDDKTGRVKEPRVEIFRDCRPPTLRRCTRSYATLNLHKRLFSSRSFPLGPKQILTEATSASLHHPVILQWSIGNRLCDT